MVVRTIYSTPYKLQEFQGSTWYNYTRECYKL